MRLIAAGPLGIFAVKVQYLNAVMTTGHMTGSSQLLLARDVDALAFDPVKNRIIFHDIMKTTIRSVSLKTRLVHTFFFLKDEHLFSKNITAQIVIKLIKNFTKTCLYIVDPLKTHFYIVKLGFTGVYIIFLILLKNHRLWVLVRTVLPRQF